MEIADVFRDLPTLETERLILRKLTLDDARDMFEFSSDPDVPRYMVWEAHESIEDTRAFLKNVVDRYARGEPAGWGVHHKGDDRLIGTISLGFAVGGFDWPNRRSEVGYWIAKPYWNQGLTTEALGRVLAFGLEELGLNRIEAKCSVENVGSYRVMEKAGMRFEGVLREQMLKKGTFHDMKMYSILRKEFNPTPN